jgi:hypothetical protein
LLLFNGHVHSAYNPYFLTCFFNRNSIFLSQQISQPCFSAGLLAQPDHARPFAHSLATLSQRASGDLLKSWASVK